MLYAKEKQEVVPVFIITDAAADKAKEFLAAEGKSEWGVRIMAAGSSCCGPSYGMDLDKDPKDEDEVTEKNGFRVFTDKDTYAQLDGMKMDYVDNGQQQGFVIQPDVPEGSAPSCSCPSGTCK
jgi:iron-sulfur cluster assembly protein